MISIKQILRHLFRRKLYSGINIIGLGIGLGCTILMATYVIHEFSYDKYYKNASRIYRVIEDSDCDTYYATGEAFKNEIPEIEDVCRFFNINKANVKNHLNQFIEQKVIFADPEIITFFDLEILTGDPENQLKDPNSIMISKKMMKKYFPDQNPVGQKIELTVNKKIIGFNITAVYSDIPSFSSFQSDFIACIDNAFDIIYDLSYTLGFKKEKQKINYKEVWENSQFTNFVKLTPNSNLALVEKKCTDVFMQHKGKDAEEQKITLQPVTDMYLYSEGLNNNQIFVTNQYESLKIFMGIGLLILLVAIINFILISNADNKLAMSDIACRKVNGASRKQIFLSSLYRSLFISLVSLLPALLFVWLIFPYFNNLFDKDLQFSLFFKWKYILILIAITVFTGISSGFYLGVYISGVNPASLLQNRLFQNRKGKYNGSLVVVQFVVFILLTGCFSLMYKQYQFSLHKDLGFNSKNILAIDMNEDIVSENMEYIKNQVLKNPNVIDCTPTSFTTPPSDNYINFSYKNKEGGSSEFEALVFGKGVIEMLEIPLIEGRTFDETDKGFGEKFIINKVASEKYNIGAGDKLDKFDIIGVSKNFNFHSLHRNVGPVFIALQSENFHYLLIKTNGNNKDVIDFTRQICKSISSGFYMDCQLLDDRIADFYKKEEKQIGTIGFFLIIALVLSALGLIGFVTLNLVGKTKEIGIRKINGASVIELLGMINKQYYLWIFIAFIIASPITYYAINKWLEGFAYKIDIGWGIFLLSGISALCLATIIVTIQSWSASRKNPVEALRYE